VVQILPADDVFDAGSPVYGTVGAGFLPLYLGARLTSTGVNGIWLPDGNPFIARPMHSGYATVTPVTGVRDDNAAFYSNGSSAVRSASGAQFRRPFGADVTVTGLFEMRTVGGTAGLAQLAPRGVFARNQAGSLIGDASADPGTVDSSCYFAAVYQKSSDSTLRLGIIRFNTGTETLLAESAAIPTGSFQWGKLATVALVVSGTGASVTLGAQLVGFGGTTPIIVGAVDSSGSRLTAAGRCGFVMGSDRSVGAQVVDLCHMFQVEEGGAVVLRDEFTRLSLAAAKVAPTDIHGRTGNYLSSAFYWDAGTFDGSFSAAGRTYTGGRKLRRNTIAGRIEFDHQTTDDDVNAGRLILSQRPASNTRSQHRSAGIIIPSAPVVTTGEVWAGIILRASQALPTDEDPPLTGITSSPNIPVGTGYMLVLRAVTSTSITWQVHRITNGGHFSIARFTEASPFATTSFAYGTLFTLDLDCYPRSDAYPNGPVELVCRVNGVLLPLVMTAAATSAGMFSPSTGIVVDPTTSRIQSGRGEGLVAVNGFLRSGSAAANIDPVFEAWTQGALTNAVVLDEDQASVVMLPEPAVVGADLDTILAEPNRDLSVDSHIFTLSNPFESGHRQTVARYLEADDSPVERRTIPIRVVVREAVLSALLAHFDSVNGVEGGFNYTLPGDIARKYHYRSDRIRHRMLAPDAYEVEFELEQLR
jgi:hypothetical protein